MRQYPREVTPGTTVAWGVGLSGGGLYSAACASETR